MDRNKSNDMKNLIIIAALVLVAIGSHAQFYPTMEGIKFGNASASRGVLWEFDELGDNVIRINGTEYVFQTGTVTSTTTWWEEYGSTSIVPDPATKIIRYPAMPTYTGSARPNYFYPVWWDDQAKTWKLFRMVTPDNLVDGDTITGCQDVYTYTTPGADAVVNVDSLINVCGCFIIKNAGLNSSLTIQSLDGYLFDTSSTITLQYNQWVNICPAESYIMTAGNNTEVLDTRLFRYSAYSDGDNNMEVLASKEGITAALANSNELTITIPTGTKILSAKIRMKNLSTLKLYTGNTDAGNTSLADRWNPVVQAWREDTGQQLMGVTTTMSLTDHKLVQINGLINTTICQIRVTF